jgi:hypothetical protein
MYKRFNPSSSIAWTSLRCDLTYCEEWAAALLSNIRSPFLVLLDLNSLDI